MPQTPDPRTLEPKTEAEDVGAAKAEADQVADPGAPEADTLKIDTVTSLMRPVTTTRRGV